jgi:hypothetical protein
MQPIARQLQQWKWGCFLYGLCRGVILKIVRVTQSVESQPVKRRLGALCEMAASMVVVSREMNSAWAAVEAESEHVQLKNPQC